MTEGVSTSARLREDTREDRRVACEKQLPGFEAERPLPQPAHRAGDALPLKTRGGIGGGSCSFGVVVLGWLGEGGEDPDGFAGLVECCGGSSPVGQGVPPFHTSNGVFDGHPSR